MDEVGEALLAERLLTAELTVSARLAECDGMCEFVQCFDCAISTTVICWDLYSLM